MYCQYNRRQFVDEEPPCGSTTEKSLPLSLFIFKTVKGVNFLENPFSYFQADLLTCSTAWNTINIRIVKEMKCNSRTDNFCLIGLSSIID